MKGKQFALLLALAVVLGGAWYLLSEHGSGSWSATGGGGGKVVDFPINDVAQIDIKNAESEVNLVKKGDVWTVQERADYPASFEQVSDVVRKLWELKTVQEVKVGPSQLPRLELVAPGSGEKTGTLVQFLTADGKPINGLILGKKQMRKTDGGEMDFGGPSEGFPTGRYVKPVNSPKVSLVSATLEELDPKPEHWLAKDYVKIESPKSITVAGPAEPQHFSLSRENATAEWKLADAKGDEKLDAGKSSPVTNVFSAPSFNDVLAPDAKLEDPVTTATIDTFDGFHYELKVGKPNGENYPVLVQVSATLAKERTPGKDEKPEDKTRLDTEFTTKQTQLEEKLAKEKKFEGRAFLLSKFTVDPLLKNRAELLADKPAEPAKPAEPGAPGEPAKPSTPGSPTPAVPAPAPEPAKAAPAPAAAPAATPAPPTPKPEDPAAPAPRPRVVPEGATSTPSTTPPPPSAPPATTAPPVTVTTPPVSAPPPKPEAATPPVQVPPPTVLPPPGTSTPPAPAPTAPPAPPTDAAPPSTPPSPAPPAPPQAAPAAPEAAPAPAPAPAPSSDSPAPTEKP